MAKSTPAISYFVHRLTKLAQTAQNKCTPSNDLSLPLRRRYLALNPAACCCYRRSAPEMTVFFCIFFANPTSTSNLTICEKPMNRWLQRYIVLTENCQLWVFTYMSRIYFGAKNMPFKPMGMKIPGTAPSLGHLDPHLIHKCLIGP